MASTTTTSDPTASWTPQTHPPPSLPHHNTSNLPITWLRQAWLSLPASLRSRRFILTATALPLTSYLYLSTHTPLHDRVNAALTPLHSSVFNYHYGQYKRALFSSLRGDVLDLSPADGANFPLYPTHLVYSAVEPNAFQLSRLAQRAAEAGYPVGTIALSNAASVSQALSALPDASKDAVIASEVLSRRRGGGGQSQDDDDVTAVLREIHRVLKPGGRLYFVDYTARNSTDRAIGLVQALLTPLTRLALNQLALDRPVAQTLLRNDQDWEMVWMQCWRRGKQPAAVQLLQAEGGEAGGVSGLEGVMPVVGGVCVKRKVSSLSAYARQTDGRLVEELLSFGTFKGRKAGSEPAKSTPGQRGGPQRPK